MSYNLRRRRTNGSIFAFLAAALTAITIWSLYIGAIYWATTLVPPGEWAGLIKLAVAVIFFVPSCIWVGIGGLLAAAYVGKFLEEILG